MNKVLKYSISALIAGVLVASFGYTGQASVFAVENTKNVVQQTPVILKWKGKTLSQKGLINNGNTLIPVSVLKDELGLPLSYNQGTRTYYLGSGYRQLNMDVSEYGVSANVNNYYIYDYEVKNIGGKLYIPFKLLSDYMGVQGVWNPSLKSLSITPRAENDVKITTELLETKTKDTLFLVRYPKLSGLGNAEVEKSINAVLEKHKNQFVEDSKEQEKKRDSSVDYMYQAFQNFAVTYNENGMLSLVIDQYSYTGGAHDGTIRTGFTFSLKDGKVLSLEDLLKEKSPTYKVGLDKLVMKNLKGINGFSDQFKGLGQDADYYLKPDGLAVFFQQYEYTPYAAGIPTFVIPYNQVLPKGTSLVK
ncbi:PdaC/SigV domain-containing protein [Paenibacillus glacialis]|uniref:Copper amine oxidase n=1 Tax=Paenibacillus glacialis TaxID=494026 RepID=A0A168KM85_9BACL|nr:DUF4163 domain-containing protein [Paenibacillus glacialis]OAB42205.1 hypothetical protein PGLA_12910 [Paenibacillus glacialis]